MSSDTLVLQSHSWRVLRGWVGQCCDTVRSWTEANGYDYRFLGDEIFDVLPSSYREKLTNHFPIQADLARLLLMQIALNEGGYQRTLWLDADVLVFAPNLFTIEDIDESCAFGRELWVDTDAAGRLKTFRNVHNAACLFQKRDPVLPFLIETTQRVIGRTASDGMDPQIVSTKLLTTLHGIYEFSMMNGIGSFSPAVLEDIAAGNGPALDRMLQVYQKLGLGLPGAANLCASLHAEDPGPEAAIERLLARGLT